MNPRYGDNWLIIGLMPLHVAQNQPIKHLMREQVSATEDNQHKNCRRNCSKEAPHASDHWAQVACQSRTSLVLLSRFQQVRSSHFALERLYWGLERATRPSSGNTQRQTPKQAPGTAARELEQDAVERTADLVPKVFQRHAATPRLAATSGLGYTTYNV